MLKTCRFYRLLCLALVMCLAGCVQPVAQTLPPVTLLDQITAAGVVRVGVAEGVPPFAFIDRQGERQGFDIEVMGEIARRLGVEIVWVDAAYEPLREMVRDRRLDLGIGAIPYIEEWDRNVDFTRPYYDLGQPGPADPGLLYIVLPQGETALAQQLNGIIDELERQGFIRRLAEKYLAPQEQTALQRQIEATDRQIDLLVYELYGLTEDEIAIVEGWG